MEEQFHYLDCQLDIVSHMQKAIMKQVQDATPQKKSATIASSNTNASSLQYEAEWQSFQKEEEKICLQDLPNLGHTCNHHLLPIPNAQQLAMQHLFQQRYIYLRITSRLECMFVIPDVTEAAMCTNLLQTMPIPTEQEWQGMMECEELDDATMPLFQESHVAPEDDHQFGAAIDYGGAYEDDMQNVVPTDEPLHENHANEENVFYCFVNLPNLSESRE